MVAIANIIIILHQNVVQLAMLCGMCFIFLYAHVSHIRYFFSSSGMDALTEAQSIIWGGNGWVASGLAALMLGVQVV